MNLLSAISGIIGFCWVGLRADMKGVKEAWSKRKAQPKEWRSYFALFLVFFPYVMFFGAAAFITYQGSQITVIHHVIKTVQAGNRDPVLIQPMIELASSDKHFLITISGSLYGPELRSINRRFGQGHPVKVYAVVSEASVPVNKRELVWVQASKSGVLNPVNGDYLVNASLGGTGSDAWHDGDVFIVRIYIPNNQDLDFTKAFIYENVDALPKPLFLSPEPLYIRCKHPVN